MIYKSALVIAIALVGVGLIFNAAVTNRSTPVAASGDLPAVSETGFNPSPLTELDQVDPVTYDEVLTSMHPGQWFGWSNPDNKVYENLIVLDKQYGKPTQSLLDGLVGSAQTTRSNIRVDKQTREANRITLETAIVNGSASDADIRQYLRLLGDF